jgi:hypothetical protein
MDSDILVLQMWVRFYRDQLIKLSTDYDQLKNDFDSMEKTMILKIIKKISKKIVENELGENEQKYHSDFKVVFEYTKKNGSILNDFPEFKCLMINLLT